MNFTKFPRRGYLQGQTPIEPMKNLSKALGGKVNLYVKRDDLLPGASGGNKTRKLDFCIADALEKGADTIITCGAVQSNHCRLTASWAAKEGLECHLVLEERVKGTFKEDASGNNFLFELLNVKTRRCVAGGSDMMAEMEKTAEELRAAGKKPYIVPGGASNPIGALGYAACAEEMMNQLNTMDLSIDHVVVPSGSAGTHAGMITGMVGTNSGIAVSGINVSRTKEVQEEIVHGLAEKTAELLGVKGGVAKEDVCCYGDYVGPGYSLPTEGMIEAVKLFAKEEAILLDPVYTGKVAAGLIDLVRKGAFPEGSNVLFLHTGGSPALYAYLDTFRG
ncbi:MAG: D-cysteine desulfhydrase [Desulfobacterales bacterium]|nr:D-cysteine desulfhydrase [Desulfobacterales bacterium]